MKIAGYLIDYPHEVPAHEVIRMPEFVHNVDRVNRIAKVVRESYGAHIVARTVYELEDGEETQYSILCWGTSTFGPTNAMDISVRMNKEVGELLSALNNGADRDRVADELADVEIMLRQIAEIKGVDLQAAVNHKMQINRNRTWAKDENGSFRHVS